MKNVLDQNFASVIVFFISPVHWFHISQQDIVRYNGAKMCQLNHDALKTLLTDVRIELELRAV